MESVSLQKIEMNMYGFADLGVILSAEEVAFFKADLTAKKQEDIAAVGQDALLQNGDLEVVRDLARFGDRYFGLIENPKLNAFVDSILNEKAVVHSYNGIMTRPDVKSDMLGYEFHRDQPFFKDTRTAINVMIPLVDYAPENGATQFVPSSHLFKQKPPQEFLEKHAVSVRGVAGQAYAIDATVWHRAGRNSSADLRPLIAVKYTLAPFKQQVDYCDSASRHLDGASDLVRGRLGWFSRVCSTFEEFRMPGNVRKFRTGNYDMTNTDIHEW